MAIAKLAAHPPRCPFCGSPVDPPRDIEPKHLGDFSYGACTCGAVFVCDITGYNLGAAFSEALGFACDEDWELAWNLIPGEDYEDALVEGYDQASHLVHPTGRTKEGKRVRGVLTFIRLGAELQDLKPGDLRARLSSSPAGPEVRPSSREAGGARRRYSKKEVEDAVGRGECGILKGMALDDPLVLRKMQRLLYSADEAMRWKAVLSLGEVAGGIADQRPAQVGDLLRRLLYASNDSAAANWGAIETVGEIIRSRPDIYGGFVNNILALLRDPPSRPAVLWALGRIGGLHPEVVRKASFFAMLGMLEDKDPAVRGHACWALGEIGAVEARSAIEGLVGDPGVLCIFDGEKMSETTVGSLAAGAVEKILEVRMDSTGPEHKRQDTRDDEFQRAVKLYREGELLIHRGMTLDAMSRLEEALGVFEALGVQREIANTCEKKADVHVIRGDFKRAVPLYQRAMAICEKVNDPVSTVILADKIIDLYRKQNVYDKALPYYFRALELVEGLEDSGRAGFYLAGIGDVYERQGRLEDALEAYRIALKIYRGMGARERADILERGISTLEKRVADSAGE